MHEIQLADTMPDIRDIATRFTSYCGYYGRRAVTMAGDSGPDGAMVVKRPAAADERGCVAEAAAGGRG